MDELLGVAVVLLVLYALSQEPPVADRQGGDVTVIPPVDATWWHSTTADREGIDNTPPPELMTNLWRLAQAVDSVFGRDGYTVTSGYRSPELNTRLGELGYAASPTSYHLKGRAADLAVHGMEVADAADLARTSGQFVEVIPYPDDGHVHVAIGA